MLTNFDAIVMIAVRDVARAKRFYWETLGLRQEGVDNEQVVGFASGRTHVNIYRSEYASTNQATSAMWVVGDHLDALAAELRGKGVRFEQYDLPGAERQGDVHVFGGLRVAWFRDPDGNILSIQNM
jgi:catechol 2,3-dioxygenase-like lactoylglutathione lyase family enzyme